MRRATFFLALAVGVLLVSPCNANARILKRGGSREEFNGLQVENFKIEGNHFKVGETITAEFDLKNTSRRPVKLGKYGAFVACRKPDDVNGDFAHQYRYGTIHPLRQIHVKGSIKIDSAGVWKFWVGVSLIRAEWGPYQWGLIQLKAVGSGSHHPAGGSGSGHHGNGSGSGHHGNSNPNIVLRPPFNNFTCWKTSPGDLVRGSKARCFCNSNTGYLGILDSAFVGGAASEPTLYAQFHSPKTQKVRVRATFYFTGGTETIGAAAFAGLQAVYRYGSVYRKKDIIPGLNYKIAAEKIVDLALMAAPGLSKPKDVEDALDALDMVNNLKDLANALKGLYNARKAKKYTLTFTMPAHKGYNFVGLGLRGNCSAVITGSSFVVVAAQLNQIEIQPE